MVADEADAAIAAVDLGRFDGVLVRLAVAQPHLTDSTAVHTLNGGVVVL